MAENINLVGQFRDKITPKLKRLNRELTKTTKAFTKMGRAATKATNLMAKPMAKVNTQLAAQTVS